MSIQLLSSPKSVIVIAGEVTSSIRTSPPPEPSWVTVNSFTIDPPGYMLVFKILALASPMVQLLGYQNENPKLRSVYSVMPGTAIGWLLPPTQMFLKAIRVLGPYVPVVGLMLRNA